MATWNYKKLRKLRDLLTEELASEVTSMGVGHLQLIEQRIANILAAGVDETMVETEKKDFKKR